MNHFLLWQIAYHLAGSTLIGKTSNEPLGALPIPVRTAVLKTATELEPVVVNVHLREKNLSFSEGSYEWIDGWEYKRFQNDSSDDFNVESIPHSIHPLLVQFLVVCHMDYDKLGVG
ncbi:MAG: hypothetical protein HC827_03710 [Cyanobacteria bacterium RM1_2_2]|nr:hypothetical protein [Cyanobacteria bacterium RM1_2_2]